MESRTARRDSIATRRNGTRPRTGSFRSRRRRLTSGAFRFPLLLPMFLPSSLPAPTVLGTQNQPHPPSPMEPPDAPSSSASSQQTSSVTSPRGLPFHALISPRRRANAAQRSPKQRSHAPILGSNDGRALTLQPGPRASSRSRQARSGHTWTVASPSLPPLSTARQRRTDDRFVLGSQRLGQPSAISAEPFSPMVIDSSEGSSDEEGAGQTLLGRLPRHPLDRSQSPQPSTSDIRLPSYDEDADENNGFPLSSPPTSMVTDQSPLDIRKKGSGLHDVGGTVFQSTLQGTPTRRPVSTASPPSSSYYASWLGLDLHPHSRFSNFRQSSGPDLVHRMRANALGASTLALPASLGTPVIPFSFDMACY